MKYNNYIYIYIYIYIYLNLITLLLFRIPGPFLCWSIVYQSTTIYVTLCLSLIAYKLLLYSPGV